MCQRSQFSYHLLFKNMLQSRSVAFTKGEDEKMHQAKEWGKIRMTDHKKTGSWLFMVAVSFLKTAIKNGREFMKDEEPQIHKCTDPK